MVVVVGAGVTVSVAAPVKVTPQLLVKIARYLLPLWASVTLESTRGLLVAPGMSLNPPPPVLTCQTMLGVGVPSAEALKLTVLPKVVLRLLGLSVTSGAELTVSVAGLEVRLPHEPVIITSYLPALAAVVDATL